MNLSPELPGFVGFDGLKVTCIIGLLPEERVTPQTIELSVHAMVDFKSAGMKTDTTKTVDWGSLAKSAERILMNGKFFLGETACLAIARHVLEQDAAYSVSITLTKFEISGTARAVARLEATKDKLPDIISALSNSGLFSTAC